MIVPSKRLLVLLTVTLPPCGLVAAVWPSFTGLAAIAAFVVMAIVIGDAFVSRRKLCNVNVKLPELVRSIKGRPAIFDVQLARGIESPQKLRVGLVTPREIGAQEELQTTLGHGEQFQVSWPIAPSQRGSYAVTEARLETSSAMGLWSIRDRKPVQSEFRVYPDLLTDKKAAASLLLNRTQAGVHVQRQVGKGREFEKLREYVPGDTYDDIHWRATARHGRPVTKVYQVERTQEVYVVLDCSRLSGRVARSELVIEQYVTASLLLGLSIEKEGDLFGVIAFDERVQRMVRAAAGRAHFGTCREALYTLAATRASPDFRELSQFIRTRLRKRALLVILTDLDDAAIAEEFERNVSLLRQHHLVVANMIRPAGVDVLFSADDVESPDQIYDRIGGHLRWHKLQEHRSGCVRAVCRCLAQCRPPCGGVGGTVPFSETQTALMIADIERFVAEERRYWIELESLLDIYERSATHRMTLAEAQRFLYLYERCSASLARLTPMSVDAGLRSYVESLVARAYGEAHEVRRRGPRPDPFRWFFRTFPRVFRGRRRAFALSMALTLAGVAFGVGALAANPDSRSVLMPFPGLLQDPKERVARETVDTTGERKTEFAAQLMTHNTRVAIFTMSLGITFGAGTALVLFANGLMLGAVAFDYIRAGQRLSSRGGCFRTGRSRIQPSSLRGKPGSFSRAR